MKCYVPITAIRNKRRNKEAIHIVLRACSPGCIFNKYVFKKAMQRVGIGMYIGIYLYLKKKHKYKPKLIKMIICKEKERTGRNGQKYK